MELILKRIAKQRGYTIGRLTTYPQPLPKEGEQHPQGTPSLREGWGGCDTLEPQWRDLARGAKKVKGRTAIPAGRYLVSMTWSPRFERTLPLLLDVPQFEGIRIHAGNYPKDTEGCILVGANLQKGALVHSRATLNRLLQLFNRHAGERTYITIKD